jgi:uncharacterized protein (DUF4213/DUF364 family)
MSDKWQLYDDLIRRIPEDITVTDCVLSRWTYVATDAGTTGIAMTTHGGDQDAHLKTGVIGTDLRTVAALVKSWNLELASIGTAAINSWYNTTERMKKSGPSLITHDGNTFRLRADRMAGRKVAVVGHFGGMQGLADICRLTVLERNPRGSDLFDSACEYVLPAQDEVCITGATLTNKTLPRLLELSAGAHVTLVGPSAPLAPEAYGDTVTELGGAVVADAPWCRRTVRSGGGMAELRSGLQRFNVQFSDGGRRS